MRAAVVTGRVAAYVGAHLPGWRLPRETDLARRYDATQAEISQAIQELAARHLLRRLPDGTLYRASPAEYLITLEGLAGIGTHIDPMGTSVACESWQMTWRRVPQEIGLVLGLPAPAEATVLRYVWTAHGHRAASSITYVPGDRTTRPLPLAPGTLSLDTTLNLVSGSRSRWVADALHIEIQPPAQQIARLLDLGPGVPAASITVRFTDPALNHPVALSTTVLRCDLFRIVVDSPLPPSADTQPGQGRRKDRKK